MRTISKTVYAYAELTDSAKSAARDWWRECETVDFDTDSIFEDAQTIARMLGLEFKQVPVKLIGGATRYDPAIYWSGFSSQGDGACFEGTYCYAKAAPRAVAAHTGGTDNKLVDIATRLQAAQRAAFYRATATVSHSDRYMHARTMRFEFDGATVEQESEIADCLRDFADWIYRQLESEYEYRMADENVVESIEANAYEFDENGKIAAA